MLHWNYQRIIFSDQARNSVMRFIIYIGICKINKISTLLLKIQKYILLSKL